MKIIRIATALALSAAMLAGCAPGGGSDDSGTGTTSLALVGFAVPKAGNNAAQAAFAKTDDGKGTKWRIVRSLRRPEPRR